MSVNLAQADSKEKNRFLNSGAVFSNSSKLPFSEAVRVGNTYYLSGQIGILPGTMSLVKGGIKEEAMQSMSNIKAILKANNLSMSNIVKCTIMMADMSEWAVFNDIYKSFFVEKYPAGNAFGVNTLALEARIEIVCVAAS